MREIKVVSVIGANGIMGCGVAGIFASFGNAKVYMICRDYSTATEAVKRTVRSVKADSISVRLIPKTYDDLEACIAESDLIFESISENFVIKSNINKIIAGAVRNETVIATGTSGLSINKLSECFDDSIRSYYLGLHFFNPPYSMTLCEVIPSKHTDEGLLKEITEYLTNILYRNVITVKDSPAFLGNRIGFQFINKALQYAEKFKHEGGIDYIDAVLGTFTGRSMPPLITADFVGLDIHKAIVDNIYENTNDYLNETFKLPEYVMQLIKENKLGKKTSLGLYQSVKKKDIDEVNVYDIESNSYRPVKKYRLNFKDDMISKLKSGRYIEAYEGLLSENTNETKICMHFLIQYIIYSIIISNEACHDACSADVAMAYGFNWIPPLALLEVFGGKKKMLEYICNNHIVSEHEIINISKLLSDIPCSQFDYRSFLKAR